MSPAQRYWLDLILVTWTVTSVTVLAAMLGSLVRHRRRVDHGATRPSGTTAEAAWIVVPITIVVLMVVLAFRFHEPAGNTGHVDVVAKATTTGETSAASPDE